jgi:deoxycytidine triphosphate deaminase
MNNGLVSYEGLLALVANGTISCVEPSSINGCSINVTLQDRFLVEDNRGSRALSFANRESPPFYEVRGGVCVPPGGFVLGALKEKVTLPDNLACTFYLRSSAARMGINHSLAMFADPGYSGHLTLEITNVLRHHPILLRGGDQIGQLLFWHVDPVPQGNCYASTGAKYSQDNGPQPVKPEHGA